MAIVFTSPSWAQNEQSDLYTSPNFSSGIAIPGGAINLGPGGKPYNPGMVLKPADAPANPENFLGCGGVGQGEYTSALFNMPESFDKFQRDINSILAKQILAMNFVMPQTGALFDQLNNYGDQRYQSFQQGCNLDSLRKSAKDQYLNACVAKIQPDRLEIIKKGGTPAGGAAPAGDPPYLKDMNDEQINTWAYAQAWEICSNQYVSDTEILEMRTKRSKDLTMQIRDVENVTRAIVPLLCKFPDDKGKETCWHELLIPQVRLCLDATMGCDTEKNAYNVREPIIGMQRLFDTMRFLMDDTVIVRRVNPYLAELDKLPDAMLDQSAREAGLSIGYTTLFRTTDGVAGDKKPKVSSYEVKSSEGVLDFQVGYLNCKDPDMSVPLNALSAKVNIAWDRSGRTGTKPVLASLSSSDFDEVIDLMKIKDGADADIQDKQKEAFSEMIWTALGCTANQTVPIFDPNIVSSLVTQCLPQDQYAYFSMAGYDTASTATRDVYRYLNSRLKQVYAHLMTDSRVPQGTSAPSDAEQAINPELNRRLALVVKETMIPYVENQLARLDEVQKSRGEFAQRVQQIYSNKSGCMYGRGPAAPAAPK